MLSAIVPTAIAQRWFSPNVETERAVDAQARKTPHRGAEPAPDARLTVLAVEGKLPAYAASLGEVDEVKREEDEFFNGVLHAARYSAEQRRVSVRTDLVPGHSAEVIVHYAVAHAHDLIVVAHHVHLFGDVFLGSTADQVAHHAPCPVMVVR